MAYPAASPAGSCCAHHTPAGIPGLPPHGRRACPLTDLCLKCALPPPPPNRRLPLLEVHCAVWPHKIAAAVYAPVDGSGRVVCLDRWGRPREQGWLSGLLRRAGLGSEPCPYAGWGKGRLRHHVRGVQQRAQARGERLWFLLLLSGVVGRMPASSSVDAAAFRPLPLAAGSPPVLP